ncbi:322ad217-00c0-4be7-8269-79ef246af42e [Thermothielavioides terrestris]|uniref:322ad217-00c0-4be7-8269-79ef246af42e n=1 Tax=Thermothielavioides terrestris TaxID=2587410 RepID=A0A3S4BR05_9PEZI|nr:322ad217-00c0-4be7-8269-79ef246af42e [Thermothielavioides terrestris]
MIASNGWASAAAAAIFVFLSYRYLVYPALLSPLSRVPSAHWSAPFSRLWILWIRFARRENRTLLSAHRRLGPVVRVGPYELSINDTDSVRTVYQGGFEKPAWYSVFDNYGVPCMFSARPAAEHSARKRLISRVYSKSYIQSCAAASAQGRAILYERLLPILKDSVAEAEAPHGIDVYSIFMAATMDFIASYIFGLGNGTDFLGDKAYREHFLELYRARNDYGYYDQEMPRLTRFCRRIGIPLCPRWVDGANQELGAWCRGLCDELEQLRHAGVRPIPGTPDEPVVWSAVADGLANEQAKNGRASVLYSTALSNVQLSVASELFDHVLAGQETAGLALTYLTWRLSQSLDLQNRLRAELLTLRPNMQLARDGTPSMPDLKQLDSLPLLHAVLMETLRLHAPIPGPQPRQTPEAGCYIGSYHVPGGVRIAALAYTLHRDESIFPEPEKWDPDRWLPSRTDPEDLRRRNRQFWAFSSGGRMCIGSNFAMHEMKLIIAAIYSNYTSHIVDDEGLEAQSDGYTGRPGRERLFLRFENVV